MESQVYETLIAVIIFAAIFFFGAKLCLPKKKQHRRLMSFAAGVSVAYVFIHLLPELQTASEVILETAVHHSRLTEYMVYLSAMIGFMLFYGMEQMIAGTRSSERTNKFAFRLHIGGFAVYVWLVSYLMVNNIEETTVPIALYAFAMGFHLFSIDHSLRREHGSAYAGLGKNILAAAALLGWVVGILIELPISTVVPLLGFVSGGVIMNAMIMELPSEKEGKFFPFLLGGIVYAVLLLLIE